MNVTELLVRLPCAQFGTQFDALKMPLARATEPPQLDQRSFLRIDEPSSIKRTVFGRTRGGFLRTEVPGTVFATSE